MYTILNEGGIALRQFVTELLPLTDLYKMVLMDKRMVGGTVFHIHYYYFKFKPFKDCKGVLWQTGRPR